MRDEKPRLRVCYLCGHKEVHPGWFWAMFEKTECVHSGCGGRLVRAVGEIGKA